MTEAEKLALEFDNWFRREYQEDAAKIDIYNAGAADSAIESISARHKKSACFKAYKFARQQGKDELKNEGYILNIEVEKYLCTLLGKEWEPSGMSIETLCAELKQQGVKEAQEKLEAFMKQQQDLPDEFKKVLNENLWELYL